MVGGFSLWMLIGFYPLLAAVTLYWEAIVEWLRSSYKPVILISVLLVSVVLIETPDGRYMLIGGGESATRLLDELGCSLPLFHRELDL